MSPTERRTKLQWLRDVLSHMESCCDAWQAADERTARCLADALQRDLEDCQRLCGSLRRSLRDTAVAAG